MATALGLTGKGRDNARTEQIMISAIFPDEVQQDTDSRFHVIILAGLRTKQLLHGAKPRIEEDRQRRSKNTTIALEEVRRGLVQFTANGKHGE